MNLEVKSLTGEAIEALYRCNVCEVSRPSWAFHSYSKNHTAAGRRRAVCRACEGGGGKNPTSLREQKKLGVPIEQIQSVANERIDGIRARDNRSAFDMTLHQKRRLARQAERASQAHVEDIAPGHMHATADPCGLTRIPGVPDKPKPLPKPRKAATATEKPAENIVGLDEYIAKRQAEFEKREAAPKAESRQVRRARERRIVKDAVSATRRRMTEQEIVDSAINKGLAARGRTTGKKKTYTRTVKKLEWDIPPEYAAACIKRQGFKCNLTGEEFQQATGYGSTNPFAPSPNQIVPGAGYLNNVEYICWWVNRAISDMPRDRAIEFLRERGRLRGDFDQIAML